MFNRWFRNLRIRRKLLIVFSVIFVISLSAASAAASTLANMQREYSGMVYEIEKDLDRIVAAADRNPAQVMLAIDEARDAMHSTQLEIGELRERLLWFQIGFIFVAAVISVAFTLYAAGMISAPINRLSDAAQSVAKGDLDVRLNTTAKDETGELARSFERVLHTIGMFVKELRGLDRAFRIDGDTSNRVDVMRYMGAYAEVAEAINDILEYHVVSKKEILDCIHKIVGGEYDAPLRQFPGLESKINEAVDYLRVSVRALEQLMKQKADAESASQAKSSFLANMSHEIRTPINAILGISELLIGNEELPESLSRGLVTIYNSSNLLLGIINDILDFSKIEAGKMDIVASEYEIASLINDSTQLNMMRIEGGTIEFELEINEGIPAKLVGDELRIKQILNNLLSNAFKYTETGKVTLSVDFAEINGEINAEIDTEGIEGIGEESGTKVELILRVTDTGFGMTREQVNNLFSEYSRYNTEQGSKIEGTGLGLAITKLLIDLMHGDISVDSSPGIGTSFTVRLPQQTAGDEAIGVEIADSLRKFKLNYIGSEHRPQVTRDPMPYGSVLIVDDVEPNLYVAEGIMNLYKLKIDTALSGMEAIKKIEAGNVYDVVFMDHMMPVMDGIETTKKIREMGYKEPIVALTAYAVAGQMEMMKKSGFDDFVSKPIDTRRLNSVLNRLVRDKQTPEVIEAARKQEEEERAADASAGMQGNGRPDGSALVRVGKTLSGDIYGLDVDRGLEKFGGDEAAYTKTLRAYVSTIGSMLDSIKSIDKKKLNDYKITVHGIKGASYDILASTAGRMAESLEKAARDGDVDYIDASNATFIYSVRRLIGNLEDLLLQVDNDMPKPVKEKPDADILEKLLDACRNVSMDGVDAAMEEIDKYSYSSDDGLAGWLHENTEKMRFKLVAERLSEELKKIDIESRLNGC